LEYANAICHPRFKKDTEQLELEIIYRNTKINQNFLSQDSLYSLNAITLTSLTFFEGVQSCFPVPLSSSTAACQPVHISARKQQQKQVVKAI